MKKVKETEPTGPVSISSEEFEKNFENLFSYVKRNEEKSYGLVFHREEITAEEVWSAIMSLQILLKEKFNFEITDMSNNFLKNMSYLYPEELDKQIKSFKQVEGLMSTKKEIH